MSKKMQPQIRFDGFSEKWKEDQLSSLGHIQTGSTPPTSNEQNYSSDGLLWVTPTDISSPIVKKTNRRLSKEGEKVARIVPKDTILVTCIASIGKNALLTESGSFNQQINSLTPNTGLNPYFLYSQSYFWSEKMKKIAGQGTMQIVNKTQFSAIETLIPNCENEQEKIGNFFQSIDHNIALQQEKLNKTQNLKKTMLKKMFPKEGSKQPEVRFDGFCGDLQEKCLGQLSTKISSYPLSRSVEVIEHTEYRYIHYGDIHRGNINIIHSEYELPFIRDVFENRKPILLQKGDLVVADASEDYQGIASPCVINFDVSGKIVAGLHTIVVRPEAINPLFFYYLLQTTNFKDYCKIVGTGTKVFAISATNLLNFKNYIPELLEQEKIGNYFKELDNTIALQAEQLEKLKNIKKAYLNKMFV